MMKSFENRSAFDVINIIAGLGLALTPWVFGYAGETAAAWNAWIVGTAIVVAAAAALVAFSDWLEWANLAFGLWAIVAPWLLSFASIDMAAIAHVVAGLIAVAAASYSIWTRSNTPFSAA